MKHFAPPAIIVTPLVLPPPRLKNLKLNLNHAVSAAGLLGAAIFCVGCGANTSLLPFPSVTPATNIAAVGDHVQLFSPQSLGAESCEWTSSNSTVATADRDGVVSTWAPGHATISVACEGNASTTESPATANVVVASQQASGPIVISKGGTYSGNWRSDDPNVAAVNIKTDDPVKIVNSVVSGRGNLITVNGLKGATVTVENVTGTALDPQVAGKQRGSFVVAGVTKALLIQNCTMIGVSFGVKVVSSNLGSLNILNNKATSLEDRASDGKGGLEVARPSPGHFVLIHESSATAGAEIAWNQVIQTIGQSSTEDVFNIYKSVGGPGHPIHVHDNYMDGYSSSTTPIYTGNGITVDGDNTSTVSAYLLIEANEMVHTAGGGLMIAAGHDITARMNRIVSCGQDSAGNWYSRESELGITIWNYYDGPIFYNNSITTTQGGLVSPNAKGAPVATNMWAAPGSVTAASDNSIAGNLFTNPCLANGGTLNLQAETAERSFWTNKVSANKELIGDQHTP